MDENEEKSFLDYLPIVIGILLVIVAIYMLMPSSKNPSPNYQPMNIFGEQEYNIASAFGIAK